MVELISFFWFGLGYDKSLQSKGYSDKIILDAIPHLLYLMSYSSKVWPKLK